MLAGASFEVVVVGSSETAVDTVVLGAVLGLETTLDEGVEEEFEVLDEAAGALLGWGGGGV